MKTRITSRVLATLVPREKAYRIHDTSQPGLFIRVLPSGHASYMVTWARNKAITLGRVGMMTLDQARTESAQYLAEAHGEPLAVSQERKVGRMPTFESFLTDHFEPWSQAHHRDAINGARAIRKSFVDLLPLRLDEIDTRRVEQLRTTWLAEGLTPASANRNITRLRGVLARAVEWGALEVHPLAKLKRLKVDRRGRVRYLTTEEENALFKAMADREATICAERDNANKWRSERKKALMPDLSKLHFADHLRPLVLTSIKTGMRRGEVFNLTWDDIDLKNKIITVEGATSKSGQTRHIPINKELLETLTNW
jgi:integrase